MPVPKKSAAKILIVAFLMLCVGYIYNEDFMLSSRFLSDEEKYCDGWCLPHADPWEMKCTFKHCNGCNQCFEQDKDDKPLEDGSSNDLSVIPTSVKIIDVYGGSVTRGDQFFDHENKRFSALLGKALGIDVKNKGIAGAGPSQNLLCGIYEANIIISEYRFNEHDGKILDQCATFEAFERIKDKSKFSVLNLAEQDKNVWPCLVPSLFDYRSPEDFTVWSKIPEKCHVYAEGEECNSDEAKQAIADRSGTSAVVSLRSSCNPNETPNHALYGTPSYHDYVTDLPQLGGIIFT
ncbi:predicted protein [Chaetoceros tenuissimus]|uniref:Uncharacterized protein n=1 Tax=Chaetoceros tenuissimus TaxID=426638 RepID=A0AAD3D2C8_9STRA|nr:predicted protein [Chaetoceros tenuissimus]